MKGRWRKQKGFSVGELLVAMVVMLVVLAAVLSQSKSAFQLSNTTYEMTDAQQGLRIAQEYINRDLTSAGDGLRSVNNIRLPVTFVGDYITTSPVTNPADPDYATLPIITSDDEVAAATAVAGVTPAVNLLGGSDRITILSVDPNFAPLSLPADAINSSGANVSLTPEQLTAGGFQQGGMYFINSEYGATFGIITNITGAGGNNPNLIFANSDAFGLNKPGGSGHVRFVSRGPTNQPVPTSLMRMHMIQYFVAANGILTRRVFGAAGPAGLADSVIAENVVGLEFSYYLNGVAQPVAQLATATQQTAVRQVEVSVVARTAHGVINGVPQILSATTSTSVRNLQFREAL